MLDKDDVDQELAECLKQLRIRHHLSKAKMADRLYISEATWSRYESGESAPNVSDFIRFFRIMGDDALGSVLRVIYPGTYKDLTAETNIYELRKAAAHYFMDVASDQTVREWDYIVFGDHGSNIEPQMQEFCMLDHLPMDYRVAVAKNIMALYRIAEDRGELVGTDHVMPNIDVFIDGIRKGHEAASQRRNSYTTVSE